MISQEQAPAHILRPSGIKKWKNRRKQQERAKNRSETNKSADSKRTKHRLRTNKPPTQPPERTQTPERSQTQERTQSSEQKKRGVKTPQKIYASFCEMKPIVLKNQPPRFADYTEKTLFCMTGDKINQQNMRLREEVKMYHHSFIFVR